MLEKVRSTHHRVRSMPNVDSVFTQELISMRYKIVLMTALAAAMVLGLATAG